MENKENRSRDTQKKPDLRVKKTKRAIYRALMDLLKKNNLENITVLELTEVAEINKSTFYLHYSDIYDLYQEALGTHIRDELVQADVLQYLFTDPVRFSTWLVHDFWNPDNMRNDPFFHDSNLVYNRTLSYHICNAFTKEIIAEGLIEPSRENVLKLEFFFTGIAFIRHEHPREDNSAMIDIIAESLKFLFKDEMD
ncbi:MAG: hypothetical protein K6F54_01140 [Lachnospiraceae bacterium]|nr:hypothetical protein [Lachnospiraceae bacterium]